MRFEQQHSRQVMDELMNLSSPAEIPRRAGETEAAVTLQTQGKAG